MTSIGFGGGEVIQVKLSLDAVRDLLQRALNDGSLVELEDPNGEKLVINPQQVKVLQNSGDPESFPVPGNGRVGATSD